VLADYSGIAVEQARLDSNAFAIWLTKEVGVAVVPGTVFYSIPGHGESSVRFAFPKEVATLQAAGERLERLRA
jgi:methionine aminotransferase